MQQALRIMNTFLKIQSSIDLVGGCRAGRGPGLKLISPAPYRNFVTIHEVVMPLLRILLLALPLIELTSLILPCQEVGGGWTLSVEPVTGVVGVSRVLLN